VKNLFDANYGVTKPPLRNHAAMTHREVIVECVSRRWS